MKSTSQIKGKKKRKNYENNSCKKPLWADECPFDAGMPFPTSKPRRSQRCTSHPNKRRICFSEGLALPLQPCSVPLRACCEPTAARCSGQVTGSPDGSSLCGSGTHRARCSGTEDFCKAAGDRGTAFWKPGPCLTTRMRESKLRKGTLRPQGLFCVGARREDSNPGDLCPLHHVNPETFFRYPPVPLTCRVSLAELPDPSCPCLLARIGLSSGRRCACRRGFNRLSGLHSSLSLALPLGC